MKKIFLIILCLSFMYTGLAQNITPQSFQGKWFLIKKTATSLVFEKSEKGKLRWGDYFFIGKDGELVVGHSAQCGNDMSRFMNYGKWKFNPDKVLLKSDIDIHKLGKTFSVNFNEKQQMILIRY